MSTTSDSAGPGNVESVRAIYDGLATGDVSALRACMDPEVVLYEPAGIAIGGTYDGLDAILDDLFPAVAERFPESSIVPDRYLDAGDTVVVLGTITGTAAGTGSTLESPFVHVYDFEDGAIVEWSSHFDTALFNAALERPPR